MTTAINARENAIAGPFLRYGQLIAMALLVARSLRFVVQRCGVAKAEVAGLDGSLEVSIGVGAWVY